MVLLSVLQKIWPSPDCGIFCQTDWPIPLTMAPFETCLGAKHPTVCNSEEVAKVKSKPGIKFRVWLTTRFTRNYMLSCGLLPQCKTSSWFHPIWKILVKLEISPNRRENNMYLKPPTRTWTSIINQLSDLKEMVCDYEWRDYVPVLSGIERANFQPCMYCSFTNFLPIFTFLFTYTWHHLAVFVPDRYDVGTCHIRNIRIQCHSSRAYVNLPVSQATSCHGLCFCAWKSWVEKQRVSIDFNKSWFWCLAILDHEMEVWT